MVTKGYCVKHIRYWCEECFDPKNKLKSRVREPEEAKDYYKEVVDPDMNGFEKWWNSYSTHTKELE